LSETDSFVLRYDDFSLSAEHEVLRDAFRAFLDKHCPTSRVRDAESLGWDPWLWPELAELAPVATGVAVEAGGDGGGLVELALVAEELGRAATPVPFVDAVVAARLLAAAGTGPASAGLARVLAGEPATIALGLPGPDGRFLTGAGAVAALAVGRVGTDLVLAESPPTMTVLANLGSAPLAWRTLAGGVVIASGVHGQLEERARRDWQILMAATLVGLGDAAAALGVRYAKDRLAFGVPIGSFQAVAHPLVS
jgi:alkylation response protein AidB-like acyl-CoA dehydrogenase